MTKNKKLEMKFQKRNIGYVHIRTQREREREREREKRERLGLERERERERERESKPHKRMHQNDTGVQELIQPV